MKMQNYDVVAVEPNIEAHELFDLMSLDQALQQADVLAVLVKHREFLKIIHTSTTCKNSADIASTLHNQIF